MNKGKRIAALLIAFAMLFTGILSNAPSAEAAKKKSKSNPFLSQAAFPETKRLYMWQRERK